MNKNFENCKNKEISFHGISFGSDVSFKEENSLSPEAEAESSHGLSRPSSEIAEFLHLTKSKLMLFNNQNCDKDQGSQTKIDCTLSKIDALIPPPLEEQVDVDDYVNKELVMLYDDFADVQSSNPDRSHHAETSPNDFNDYEAEIGFNRICGMIEAKSTLKNVLIYPILFPHFFPENIRSRRVLLYGPPGTGKSLFAKAVAEEINARLYRISSADLLSQWHGESEKRIRELFEEARGSRTRIVLFFDEIDGLCRRRSSSENDLVRRVKTELLIQFEGKSEDRNFDNFFLIGATNCPWEMDSAFLRRFQKKVYISLPDKNGRIQIMKRGFMNIENELTDEEWGLAGYATEGYTGSDLTDLIMNTCCERLSNTMDCHNWKFDGNFWVPADSESLYSIRVNFEDLPSHQIQCRPVKFSDLKAAISKTPKSVSNEDLQRFIEYSMNFN